MATCKKSGLNVKMSGEDNYTTLVCTTKTGKEIHLSIRDDGGVFVHFADEMYCHNACVKELVNDETFQRIKFVPNRSA